MAQKLYTEEQVRMLDINLGDSTLDEVIRCLTPIELPSDEEIEKIIRPFEYEYTRIGFRACAQWMRDKIQGGNK